MYSEIHPFDAAPERLRALAPKGIILSGSPEIGQRASGTAPRTRYSIWGWPVLGICYGMQAMAAQLGGGVETAEHREFGYAQVRARGHSGCSPASRTREPRGTRPARRVDEPRGPRDLAAAGVPAHRFQRQRADRRDRRRVPRLLRRAVPPEVTHTRQARASCTASCTRSAAAHRLDPGRNHRGRHRTGAPRGRRGRRAARALRGRRLLGGGGAAPPRDRAIGAVHLRGQRPAPARRGRSGHGHVRRASRRRRGPGRCGDRFFAALEGVSDPEEKRKRIGRAFIEIFEEGGGEARRGPLARAGHDLPRRHRIRRRRDRQGARHQVAPQRGAGCRSG